MKIEYNQEFYENALEEQVNRSQYMMTKFADSPARKAGQLRGLVIEHHVSGWFKQNYPNNYLEADNYRIWTQPCGHDFKLSNKFSVLCIDVSGPKKDGTFGSYYYKPKYGVDYHILCNAIGFITWDNVDFKKGFEILGVVAASDFKISIAPNDIIDFKTWLKEISL